MTLRTRFRAFIVALPLFGCAIAVRADAESNANQPDVKLGLSPSLIVGVKGGGFACLPGGLLMAGNFVGNDAEFVRKFRDKFSEARAKVPEQGLSPTFAFELKKISDVKLCARSYGIWGQGKPNSLSGKATFTFAWSKTVPNANLSMGEDVIQITLDKKEAATASEMLDKAIDKFLERRFSK